MGRLEGARYARWWREVVGRSVVTVLALMGVATAGAAVAPATSLGQVLAELWMHNPQVQQALASATAAGYDVTGARTGYLPYLMANSSIANNNASATTLSLVQPLWNGGLTGAQVDAAEAERRLALVDLNKTRLDLGMQASQAYFEALLAQDQATTWAEYQAALKRLLGIIRRRAEGGLSPPVDVQTAVARLRQAEAGAAANHATFEAGLTELDILLGYKISQLRWPVPAAALSAAEVDALTTGELPATQPAVARAQQQVALAEAQVDVSRASRWPEISLQYSRLVRQSAGDFTPDSAVAIVVQARTDQSLRQARSVKADRARVTAATYGVDSSRRSVLDLIRSAEVARTQASLQLEAQRAAAAAYDTLVDSYLRQFKAGRKSWLEVLNIQRELHQTRLAVAADKRAYWAANAQMALQGMAWQHLSPQGPAPVAFEEAHQ